MRLTEGELEFLSAWAREEWEPACYELPAHRLQLAHGVAGAQLIAFIKAWTEGEGKRDREILTAADNPQPRWPWPSTGDFAGRLAEASERRTHRGGKVRRDSTSGNRVFISCVSDEPSRVRCADRPFPT